MRKILFLSFLICVLVSGPAFALSFSVDESGSKVELYNTDTGDWSKTLYFFGFPIGTIGGSSELSAALSTPYDNPYQIGDGDTIEFEFATLTLSGDGLGVIGSTDIRANLAFDAGLDPYYAEGSGEYLTALYGIIDAGYLRWNSDPGIITLSNGDFFEVSFLDIEGFGLSCPGSSTYSIMAQVTAHAAPVPEPGTIVLMGLGLVGLAGMGRKKLFKK
jgi:hypothetical protein